MSVDQLEPETPGQNARSHSDMTARSLAAAVSREPNCRVTEVRRRLYKVNTNTYEFDINSICLRSRDTDKEDTYTVMVSGLLDESEIDPRVYRGHIGRRLQFFAPMSRLATHEINTRRVQSIVRGLTPSMETVTDWLDSYEFFSAGIQLHHTDTGLDGEDLHYIKIPHGKIPHQVFIGEEDVVLLRVAKPYNLVTYSITGNQCVVLSKHDLLWRFGSRA